MSRHARLSQNLDSNPIPMIVKCRERVETCGFCFVLCFFFFLASYVFVLIKDTHILKIETYNCSTFGTKSSPGPVFFGGNKPITVIQRVQSFLPVGIKYNYGTFLIDEQRVRITVKQTNIKVNKYIKSTKNSQHTGHLTWLVEFHSSI